MSITEVREQFGPSLGWSVVGGGLGYVLGRTIKQLAIDITKSENVHFINPQIWARVFAINLFARTFLHKWLYVICEEENRSPLVRERWLLVGDNSLLFAAYLSLAKTGQWSLIPFNVKTFLYGVFVGNVVANLYKIEVLNKFDSRKDAYDIQALRF